MGAEQIGFLLRGPRELDAKLRANAIALGWLRVKDCRELMKKPNWETTENDWVNANMNGDQCEVEAAAGYTKKQVQKAVDDVYALWNEEISARDTNQRVDPFDPTMALFFAGDQTWGDTPDGLGYTIINEARRLGFLSALGIR